MKIQKKRIGQIFIDMGVADDEEIAKALSSQLKIPFLRLNDIEIPKEIISLIPAEIAENYLLVPVKETGNRLFVAMANPLELYALDGLLFVTQMAVDIGISPQKDILDAIERYYPKRYLESDLDSGRALLRD